MYINNFGEVYLSGRGDDFYLVNIPLPPTMVQAKSIEMSIMYIFDGELVIDEREGTKRLVYLFFDCIMFYNELVFDKVYAERLRYCLQFVTLRADLMRLAHDSKVSPITVSIDQVKKTKQPRIKICVKDFYPVEASGFIFNQLVPKLPHENDGLIFTRNSKPYPVGATSSIIKWKPPEYNTIDFLIVNNVTWEAEYGKTILDLYVSKYNRQTEETDYVLFDVMVTDEDRWNEIAGDLDIKEVGDDILYKNTSVDERKKIIAECKFDSYESSEALTKLLNNYLDNSEDYVTQLLENSVLSSNMYSEEDLRNNLHFCFDKKIKMMRGGWVISKLRRDKNTPNAFMTAKNVFNCIFENIHIEDLEKEFVTLYQLPQQADAAVQANGAQGKQVRANPRTEEEPDLMKKGKPS